MGLTAGKTGNRAAIVAVIWQPLLLVVVVLGCVVLFVLGFLSPARSRRPQLKVDGILGKGQRAGEKAAEKRPRLPTRLVEGPFKKARTAVAKSTAWGRKARSKVPI